MKALMVGTGEYTTGFVNGQESASDKGAGVVGLTLFDLRRKGLLDDLLMAGTTGSKFPAIRQHLKAVIEDRYEGLSTDFHSYPADDVMRDAEAYLEALDQLNAGDCVTIFTPDDSHFTIAMAAIERGCHVLIAKPLVQKTSDHEALITAAREKGVLCVMEVHKRWDPIYADARDRAKHLGNLSHFSAYMSQPKSQLETFRAWAGKGSDISYYLNAHHVDMLMWMVGESARPIAVTALAASGVAEKKGMPTEDSISLCVQFQIVGGGRASAVFTSSWIAPQSDVHSQQSFFYQAEKGEVRVDQAHRGYSVATDEAGYSSPNPLFMKYTPDAEGRFAGQSGYGYRSIEEFIKAAHSVNNGTTDVDDWSQRLATASTTLQVTKILEAGRASLDAGGAVVNLSSGV